MVNHLHYLNCWLVAHDLIAHFVCIRCGNKLSFEAEKANIFSSKANIIMHKQFVYFKAGLN